MRKFIFSFLLIPWAATSQPLALEGYPLELARKISEQHALERQVASKISSRTVRYIVTERRWKNGDTVLVAFHGGTTELHKAIAAVASEWEEFANVHLDFGFNAVTGSFRTWSPSDHSYSAHIRIGFDDSGYWSAVGSDSVNSEPYGPGKPSMNLNQFPLLWPNLMPERWKGDVRHEFGHALGFHHEHQKKTCVSEIKWSGTANVYDVLWNLAGWNAAMVDANIGLLGESAGVELTSTLDRKSIMFYWLPVDVYTDGSSSVCYIPQVNLEFSEVDKKGASEAYSFNPKRGHIPPDADALVLATEHVERTKSSLSQKEGDAYQRRAFALTVARKPILYIKIGAENNRGIAHQIEAEAKQLGYLISSIDVVKENAATRARAEIRYFRSEDELAASRLIPLLENAGFLPAILVKGEGNNGNSAGKNMVEIWLVGT